MSPLVPLFVLLLLTTRLEARGSTAIESKGNPGIGDDSSISSHGEPSTQQTKSYETVDNANTSLPRSVESTTIDRERPAIVNLSSDDVLLDPSLIVSRLARRAIAADKNDSEEELASRTRIRRGTEDADPRAMKSDRDSRVDKSGAGTRKRKEDQDEGIDDLVSAEYEYPRRNFDGYWHGRENHGGGYWQDPRERQPHRRFYPRYPIFSGK